MVILSPLRANISQRNPYHMILVTQVMFEMVATGYIKYYKANWHLFIVIS